MADLTFVPAWVIPDLLIIAVAVITVMYILKKEEHPTSVLLEMFCFSVFYAAIYENFAVLAGYYDYGKSLLMIGNVPLSVPIIEFLVVYAALRMLRHMNIPTWCKPFIVGLSGTLFDFTLDPVSVRLICPDLQYPAGIGRWTWFNPSPTANIFNVPVYNFSGWALICGVGAFFILLGRWWFKKSNYSEKIGIVYPFVTMFAALGALFLPTSQFLMWLGPFLSKGSIGEWIMLAVNVTIPVILLAVFWRGRMTSKFSFKEDYPVFLVFIGFHIVDVLTALIFGFWSIVWLEVLITAIQSAFVLLVFWLGRQAPNAQI